MSTFAYKGFKASSLLNISSVVQSKDFEIFFPLFKGFRKGLQRQLNGAQALGVSGCGCGVSTQGC